MRRIIVSVLLAGLIASAASYAFCQRAGAPAALGVLGVLAKGQTVTIRERGERYELNVFNVGPDIPGYKVREVGSDYVVIDDVSHLLELRIPIYSIKLVSIQKLAGR